MNTIRNHEPRISTGLAALDHVLGGGLVEGSTILFAGRPGSGKTTLTLQLLEGLGVPGLYVTGDATLDRVRAMADRLGVTAPRMLAEARVEAIIEQARASHAQVIAIDTIQSLRCSNMKSHLGLSAQLSASGRRLMDFAKLSHTTLWLVGHATRRDIVRPYVLKYTVDVVLRLDPGVLRVADKNRFGEANGAVGVALTERGFVDAPLKERDRRSALLEPQAMSPEQIADLIARTRAAMSRKAVYAMRQQQRQNAARLAESR